MPEMCWHAKGVFNRRQRNENEAVKDIKKKKVNTMIWVETPFRS